MKCIFSALVFLMFCIPVNAQEIKNKDNKLLLTQWAITNNYSLKGSTGQLLVSLPVQATIVCTAARTGETKTFALHNGTPKELLPGSYDVTFWGIKIPSVAIEKGKDTRILAGALNSTVKGLWEIWTANGIKIFSAGGRKIIGLPVGNYIVKTQGAEIKTTITDGKVTIFSFTGF